MIRPGTEAPWSAELVAVARAAAEVIAIPRREAETSFTLHAPLELLARVGLVPHVRDDARAAAIAGISRLAADYAATGTPVSTPAAIAFADAAAAATALDAALRSGDVDRVDRIACWLAPRVDHQAARHLLAASIFDSLGAAGHAAIALHLLPRAADGALPISLLRGALRSIAAQPTWRVDWFRTDERVELGPLAPSLADALAAVPHLGRPGTSFIRPLMAQVQDRGLATRLLAPALRRPVDPAAAGRTLLRAAAWSMLHDDPAQAPYGWSHCLTMPQGVLSLADDGVPARSAVAVAATFVAGFRAAHGKQPLGSLDDDAPGEAPDAPDAPDVTELATFAALHRDAHLVKYTLACLHAAATDPAWRSTYLRAAAYLADWWRAHPARGSSS
jgi:hypothetical protein